mmetsp:Transcript_84564/g.239717  ORF Transcript_84564/g.239717 Transcript_84564/m.239717 type:complete len:326 (-) Transcript_84564:542-1519(-)
MAYEPHVDRDVRVVRGRNACVVLWRKLLIGHVGNLHLCPVAPEDDHCAILGGRSQQDVGFVHLLLAERDARHRGLRVLQLLHSPQVCVVLAVTALHLHGLGTLERGPQHALRPGPDAGAVAGASEPGLHGVDGGRDRAPPGAVRRQCIEAHGHLASAVGVAQALVAGVQHQLDGAVEVCVRHFEALEPDGQVRSHANVRLDHLVLPLDAVFVAEEHEPCPCVVHLLRELQGVLHALGAGQVVDDEDPDRALEPFLYEVLGPDVAGAVQQLQKSFPDLDLVVGHQVGLLLGKLRKLRFVVLLDERLQHCAFPNLGRADQLDKDVAV